MSCFLVGPPGETESLGLAAETAVPPGQFQQALRHMTRAVVIGPRLLQDRDISLAAQVPLALVLTNPTDVVHTEMHARDGRLALTPCDAIVLGPALADRPFFAPWTDLLALRPEALPEFMNRATTAPLHPVPAGFETLPKPVLNALAEQMRRLKLTQYDPVVGSSAACRSLIGMLCNPGNSVLAESEGLPPDLICAEPEAAAGLLAAHPGCRMLICPAIVDAARPVEMINLTVTTAADLPVNLVRVVSGPRLANSRFLTCLIYVIG